MGARMPQFSVTIETIQIEYFQDGRVDRPLLDGEQRALGSAMSTCLFQDAQAAFCHNRSNGRQGSCMPRGPPGLPS